MSLIQAPTEFAGTEHPERADTFTSPMHRKLYDPDVTLEEYMHYARRTRAEQDTEEATPSPGILQQVFKSGPSAPVVVGIPPQNVATGAQGGDETGMPVGKSPDDHLPHQGQKSQAHQLTQAIITEDEWRNAARALRTASWGAGFYLITTDILGPYGVGFALGTLGWGPGIALYTVFAFMAGYSGYLLWQVYLGLDSYEFPLRNYGDLAFRTMGASARHLVNFLQIIQLILICGQVIILNGQGISQVSKFKLCYVVCIVIFVVGGFLVGQIRTLRNYGIVSMIAVGTNLLVIFISMGVMAHSPPNYRISTLGSAGSAVNSATITPDSNGVYPPIIHYNGLPDSTSFIGAINGLMSGVFAYGGAQIFIEIMAEMRRPWDFIKAMCIAQLFIYTVYLSYGCYVYYFQGQYSFTNAYMGLSIYGFQATCDILVVLVGLVAAGLYGNIGIKVIYNQVLLEFFHAPPLETRTGRYIFAALVPIYWSVAFIIAAAIPDYFAFVSVIAAFCVIQFSYTFPAIIHLAYTMQKDSIGKGEGFNVTTGETIRKDHGARRLLRGFLAGRWYLNVWNVIHACGALATAGLGAYAAIEGMMEAFKIPEVNAFTCRSPLDLSA
ncbi:transmembrane amino acid transporter protein-domain-containing protein [Exophiala viscosa]|uniref:Transmembrane amino acid transporter protein-domain-containing protein n=1 Tax=Exophiala viscosa TaxID=2486360 RepID=A0AAN6DUL9_9EURO|nr:transmembrane amino acid transporter protein-domain-containing protein [Exophiala viscosa]KAI1623348.1 transmembrane amino acid transporter protein-domain-containing protein [Exophiala viscosa]